MKRWIWFLVSIFISTGVYFTLRYGLRPKPIPVLNATEFNEAQQIGAVVYKRLRQEIRGEVHVGSDRVMVIVCHEPEPGLIVRRLARCYLAFVLDALDPTGKYRHRAG